MQRIVLAGHIRHQTCYIVNEKGIDRLSDTERSKQMLNKALSLGTTPRGGFRSDQSSVVYRGLIHRIFNPQQASYWLDGVLVINNELNE